MQPSIWRRYRAIIVDAFVVANLSFLAVDIYFAHSINDFHRTAEWIPFGFSLVSPPILIICFLLQKHGVLKRPSDVIIQFIAYMSIAIGIAGLIFHLKSQFFLEMNIRSLVYTAPFVAPLAYSGLGFLLLMNRKVSDESVEWGQWIVFFALGGFLGNFILSLCDHAQNGFYHSAEWIPVVASAFAVGFLAVILLIKPGPLVMKWVFAVILIQCVVGTLGFYYHFRVNISNGSVNMFENFIYGAPIFAPMLFADLALLAMIGVYDIQLKTIDHGGGR